MAKIPLLQLAREAGFRGLNIRLPVITPTGAQVSELAAIYLTVVRAWRDEARTTILPAYERALGLQRILADSPADDVEVELQAAEGRVLAVEIGLTQRISAWIASLQGWHLRRIVQSLRYSTNVDLTTRMSAYDVRLTMDDILKRNTALIRNVSDRIRSDVADIVFRGLTDRTPIRDVAREIEAATRLGRTRSLLIARDQTTKLSSTLDHDRQVQLGFTGFVWVHSGKRHPRPHHLARNGQFFRWTSPVARTDPPGRAINCGCKARASMDPSGGDE